LVDGGVVNNIPTDVAELLGADVIIAVNVPADFSQNNMSNVLMTLTQALYIQGEFVSQEQLSRADVVITPEVRDIGAMELWRSRECIAAGVAATREALPQIRQVLVREILKTWVAWKNSPQSSEEGHP